MNPPNLAPLIPFGSPPVRLATSTNPGCTDPAGQSFAPVPTDQAGSRSRCASPTVTSDGEMQHGNQHLNAAFNGTVQVSAGSGAVVQAQGEGGQLLDKRQAVKAPSTGRGLPKNIYAGNKSHVHMIPPTIAVSIPPAVDVAARSGQLGGLPTNVNIR